MNICFILPYPFGGLPDYTAEIANAISLYANVYVVAPKGYDGQAFQDRVRILPLLHSPKNESLDLRHILGTAPSFFRWPRQISVLDRITPDVVHLTAVITPQLYLAIRLNALDRRYPFVYTAHGTGTKFSSIDLESVLSRICLQCARRISFQKIIVHGDRDKNTLVASRYFPVDSSDIEVIPHPTYSFSPVEAQQDPSSADGTENSVLFFGRIREYKGLDCLLMAIPMIASRVPNIRVIVAGEGDISKYSALIGNVADMVEIHNHFIAREEVADLFLRAKVVVLPYSRMEGQSGVLHMAITFGKAVVATPLGNIPDVIRHGINGLLVPPDNPEKLAEAIAFLLLNDTVRRSLSCNLRNEVARRSPDSVARAHLRVYQKAIQKALR